MKLKNNLVFDYLIENELYKSNNIHLYNGNYYKPLNVKLEKENLYQNTYLNDAENYIYNNGDINNNNGIIRIINEHNNYDNIKNNSYFLISNGNTFNDHNNNINRYNENSIIYNNDNNDINKKNSYDNNIDKNNRNYDKNNNNSIDNICSDNYESTNNNNISRDGHFRNINNDNNNNNINSENNNNNNNIGNENNNSDNSNNINSENNNNNIGNENNNNDNNNNINSENNNNNIGNENNNNDNNNNINSENNNNNIGNENNNNNNNINSENNNNNIGNENNNNDNNNNINSENNNNDIDKNKMNYKNLKKSYTINYIKNENRIEPSYKYNNSYVKTKSKNESKIPHTKILQNHKLKGSDNDIKNLKSEKIFTKKNFNKIDKIIAYSSLKKSNYLCPKNNIQQMEKIKLQKKPKVEEEREKKEIMIGELEKKFKVISLLKTKNVMKFYEDDKIKDECIKKIVTKKNNDYFKGFNQKLSSLKKNDNTKKLENELNQKKTVLDTISLKCSSIIPKKMIDKKNIKEMKIEDDHNKINQKIQIYCKAEINNDGKIISKYMDDTEECNEETCIRDTSVLSSSYSSKRKTTITYNENDLFENKPEYKENVSFVKMNELFKDSNRLPKLILSNEQNVYEEKKELLHKNECKIFKFNCINSIDGKKLECKFLDNNLLQDKTIYNTHQEAKTITMNKCENVKNTNHIIDKTEKIDKYSIHISNLFSHSKDEFTEYMLKNVDCDISHNENEHIIPENKKTHFEKSRKVNLDKILERNILTNVRFPKENLKYQEMYCPVTSTINTPKHMKKNNQYIKNMNIRNPNKIGYKDYTNYNRRKTVCCSMKMDTHNCFGNLKLRDKFPEKRNLNTTNDKSKNDIFLKLHLSLKDKIDRTNFDNSTKRESSNSFYNSTRMTQKPFGRLMSGKIENFNLHLPNTTSKSRKIHTPSTILDEQINYDRKRMTIANNNELLEKCKCFDRTAFNKNSNILLNTSDNFKIYPKCSLICRIPHKNFRNSFYMTNNQAKTLNENKITNNKSLIPIKKNFIYYNSKHERNSIQAKSKVSALNRKNM
ncbi:conserved Plasmodium protein, unknown function [Plasmodium relictum]|uniref:Uncharacterized protein n=1 Tax=Plasmodium relictum TaxID=85471 RepID=A0A1J1H8U2_PLARL|nr:conserved Plasmodium protein, unknown function [Plasmodium relictum]CRH01206.1 conserved Plasmodium protein, unknown function [Plasmodium relictum]